MTRHRSMATVMRTLRLSMAGIVAGALLMLLLPTPVRAGNRLYVGGLSIHSSEAGLAHVQLVAEVAEDGTTHLGGTVRVAAGDRGFDELKAEPGTYRASFADVDADGTAGLVLLTGGFRSSRSRTLVPVAVSPVGGDIEERGTYLLAIRIDKVNTTLEALAAYGSPDHPDFLWWPRPRP